MLLLPPIRRRLLRRKSNLFFLKNISYILNSYTDSKKAELYFRLLSYITYRYVFQIHKPVSGLKESFIPHIHNVFEIKTVMRSGTILSAVIFCFFRGCRIKYRHVVVIVKHFITVFYIWMRSNAFHVGKIWYFVFTEHSSVHIATVIATTICLDIAYNKITAKLPLCIKQEAIVTNISCPTETCM